MKAIKILLIDDHPLFAEGMKALLKNENPNIQVECCHSANEGLNKFKIMKPDLILMDVNLPDKNGLELAVEIKNLDKNTKICIITMFSSESLAHEIKKKNIEGYILKNMNKEELFLAMEMIMDGKGYFQIQAGINSEKPQLTAREKEILRVIVQGKTNLEISVFLKISVLTVETHRKNIIRKLKVKSSAELIKYAMEMGI